MTFRSRAIRTPSSLPISDEQTFALRRGRAQWLIAALWVIILLVLPAVASTYWLHLADNCLIAIIGAVALNVLTGNARLVSLGQAAFIGIGAFTAGLLERAYGIPFVLALVAAALSGGIVGTLVALLSLRLRVLYVAVTTLVLHFAVVTLFSFAQAVFLDSTGIILSIPQIGPFELTTPIRWYYFLLAVAAIVVLGAFNLLRSFIGRRWIAAGEHDVAAEALGVSVTSAKISVFAATSAVVSMAGALSAYYVGTVSFESYNFTLAISYLAMIIVGGVGSVIGSILGAVVITLLPHVLDQILLALHIPVRANVLAGIHQTVFGLLIVLFLLFEPRGLAEVWHRVRSAVAGWPFGYRSAQRGAA
jgi:branched-chain amino acid transport system permease protein